MTNHTHLIAVPKDSGVFARAIGEAHRRYTRMKCFADGVHGYLFQGRFGSCVLDENHLIAAARYIELNPVHAGMVGKPEEYPWWSTQFHLEFGHCRSSREGQNSTGIDRGLEGISRKKRR